MWLQEGFLPALWNTPIRAVGGLSVSQPAAGLSDCLPSILVLYWSELRHLHLWAALSMILVTATFEKDAIFSQMTPYYYYH